MIKITANRKDGKINYLSVEGHANSAPKGKDLICSAVSSIAIGGCNALKNKDCFAITIEKGNVTINEKKHASEYDYDVLETMLIQLKTVEETNSKYINIIEKGN